MRIAGRDDLVAIEHTPESDRDAWLESRLGGLGGSDIAAILGEHPRRRAIDVWLEKTTGAQTSFDDERTEMGNILEPIVLDMFSAGHPRWPRPGGPLTIVKPPSVHHRDRPWQRGSADGFVYLPEAVIDVVVDGEETPTVLYQRSPSALLEIKTHGWYGSRGYALDDEENPVVSVPPEKRIQCAWYQALYHVAVCYLAALVDTHLRRTFTLHRDLELEAMLLDAGERFWTKHIVADVPPDPDGSLSYRGYLSDRFSKHGKDLVESSDEVDIALESLMAIKRDQKRLEDERELAEQTIKRAIGGGVGIRTSLGTVTWKSQASGKLRQKDAMTELYSVAGWTDDEIAAFEDRHRTPDHRVLRTPK